MHPSLNPSLVLRRLEGAGGNRNIIIAVCLLIAIPLAYVTTNNRELHEWRELYAFSGQLDDILVNKTSTNIYKSCPGNSFKLPGSDAIIGPEELKTLVAASAGEEGTGPADDDAPQEFQEVEVQYAPCKYVSFTLSSICLFTTLTSFCLPTHNTQRSQRHCVLQTHSLHESRHHRL